MSEMQSIKHTFKDLPESEYQEFAEAGIIDMKYEDDYRKMTIETEKAKLKIHIDGSGKLALDVETDSGGNL